MAPMSEPKRAHEWDLLREPVSGEMKELEMAHLLVLAWAVALAAAWAVLKVLPRALATAVARAPRLVGTLAARSAEATAEMWE